MLLPSAVLRVRKTSSNCGCFQKMRYNLEFIIIEGYLEKGTYLFFSENCGYNRDLYYSTLIKKDPEYKTIPKWYIDPDKIGRENLSITIDKIIFSGGIHTIHYNKDLTNFRVGEYILCSKIA